MSFFADRPADRSSERPSELRGTAPTASGTFESPSRVRIENLSRRSFLRGSGALVLGLQVLSPGSLFGFQDDAGTQKGTGEPGHPAFTPNVFVRLDGDGTVTITVHRSEMGQGIRTGQTAVIADEMEADWERLEIVQADGDERYGSQNTDGSRSIRLHFDSMRRAGATARHMLVAAAAAAWGVPAEECRARHHAVHHEASGRSLGYGELAVRAAELPVPSEGEISFKPRSEWRYIGKSLPLLDLDAMVTGQAIYGADVRRPDMLVGMVERSPVVGGTLKSLDAAAAKKVPGVRQVFAFEAPGGVGGGFQPLGGVAVLADTTWAAMEGRKALDIEWEPGPHGSYDSKSYRRTLEETARKPGHVVREEGDAATALEGAAQVVEALYHVPHLSQAPMEPPAAVAEVGDGRCEVWAPTQGPQTAKREVARALGIEPENVTIHVTLLGGGFGRKSKPDFLVEAALLSQRAGVPVKLQWTREDDTRHGYYHTVSCQLARGGLDEHGKPVAWHQRTVFPSIGSTFDASTRRGSAGELGLGFTDLPFAVPHLRLEVGEAEAHVRIGWMRSVANLYHAFAACSFADELAHAAGRDPRDFLLDLLGPPRKIELGEGVEYDNYGQPLDQHPLDVGRLLAVTEWAAKKAGWGRKLPKGRGLGIASHRSFLAYVAAVVDAGLDDKGKLKVHKVTCAMDCGTCVNPDRVRAQVEGAVVYGLSLAIHGEITARDGAIQQGNFHDYPVLRIYEMPEVDVHLVASEAPPAGVGEPGTPPVAPALANALFAATGTRYRELPLSRHGLV